MKDVQLLMGIRRGVARLRDEERLYKRAMASVQKVTQVVGFDAWDQIEAEAKRRGAITPIPGRDL